MDETADDRLSQLHRAERDYLISLDAYHSLKAKGVNPPFYPAGPNYNGGGRLGWSCTLALFLILVGGIILYPSCVGISFLSMFFPNVPVSTWILMFTAIFVLTIAWFIHKL